MLRGCHDNGVYVCIIIAALTITQVEVCVNITNDITSGNNVTSPAQQHADTGMHCQVYYTTKVLEPSNIWSSSSDIMAGSGGGEAWLLVVPFAVLDFCAQQTKPLELQGWHTSANLPRQASSRANSFAFIQSEKTFRAHCINCWVFPGTNPFCRSYSVSLLMNWKRIDRYESS